MIGQNDPTHKDFITPTKDGYEISTDKLPAGESLQCSDDKNMEVKKNDDGSVTLIKRCCRGECFH